MKKLIVLLWAAALLTLCACGGGGAAEAQAPAGSAAPAVSDEPAPASPEAPVAEAAPAEEAPSEEETALPEPSLMELAKGYVGRDVEELIAELGEPEAREYQDNCEIPDTQDGFLDYEGFTVVTSKTGDTELVQRVDAR